MRSLFILMLLAASSGCAIFSDKHSAASMEVEPLSPVSRALAVRDVSYSAPDRATGLAPRGLAPCARGEEFMESCHWQGETHARTQASARPEGGVGAVAQATDPSDLSPENRPLAPIHYRVETQPRE